jgi:hypothetical protein
VRNSSSLYIVSNGFQEVVVAIIYSSDGAEGSIRQSDRGLGGHGILKDDSARVIGDYRETERTK